MNLPLTSTCVGGRRSGGPIPVFIAPKSAAPHKAPAPTHPLGLTARECQIVETYIQTGVGKLAAAELGIQLPTFHTALRRLHEKVGVISSVQLVAAYVAAKRTGGFE